MKSQLVYRPFNLHSQFETVFILRNLLAQKIKVN